MSFNITVKGIDGLVKQFDKLDKGLDNFSKPLKLADQYLNREIQKNFSTEGSTLSDGWSPLAPSTIKRKKGGKMLVDSGKMKKSFQSQLTRMRLVISNPTEYFKYHQSSKSRKRLPRRQMLGLKQQQVKTINKFFGAYIKTLFK